MPCYHPLLAHRINGALKIMGAVRTHMRKLGDTTLPCGQCIGCRLERSRQWAIRCMHEASLYDENCFVTLTFADDHLPDNRSLCVTHLQKFMKRLRKRFAPKTIRFYACGEYGEQFQRPHYHLCLFNHDFTDKYRWAKNRGHQLYRSPTLEELWPYGNATLGTVTFESAAYVARYVTKKVTGAQATQHYQMLDPSTGEIYQRRPEFTVMSRRPGIGHNWLSRFQTDVYPSDTVLVRGKLMKPPVYYDRAYELIHPEGMEHLRQERRKKRKRQDETPRRLADRETVAIAQHNLSPRS